MSDIKFGVLIKKTEESVRTWFRYLTNCGFEITGHSIPVVLDRSGETVYNFDHNAVVLEAKGSDVQYLAFKMLNDELTELPYNGFKVLVRSNKVGA